MIMISDRKLGKINTVSVAIVLRRFNRLDKIFHLASSGGKCEESEDSVIFGCRIVFKVVLALDYRAP
jgi:hypothetical protein